MATGYWMLVEDPVFSGNTGCWMVGSELATLQVRDYGQRTNKKIILEKRTFYTIFANKRMSSIAYTNTRAARRSKWTD